MILQKQDSFYAILLIIFMFISIYSADGQNNVSWAGAWQYGPADAVFVDTDADMAFLGTGGAVMAIDISDPANPVLINDDIRTHGFVRDIWYESETLYLACGRSGMEIWDVSDINNPVMLSRMDILYFDEATPVEEIELYQDYAVLMCDWGYVHTVDISDPNNPEQLHFNGQMGNPAHHIYIDEFGTIHSTGAQYYLQLTIGAGGTLNSGGAREFIYGAGNLYGRENEAFVYYSGNMYILDLTLPGFPAWSITEVTFTDIDVDGGTAYLVNDDGFEIWDVSDFQNPYMMSSVAFQYGNELFIGEDYAYVSADHEGLRVIDISDPSSPQLVGQLSAYSWTPNFDMANGVGYVANGAVLYTIDISDPYGSAPEAMDNIPTMGQTNDVAIMDDLAFVADWTGGLRIIDITDPGNISALTSVPIQAWKVAAGNGYVYAVEANPNVSDTLKIYNVSDPSSPVMTAMLTLPESANDIEYQDGYVYIALQDSGLRIYDVSDPDSPVEVSVVDLVWVRDVSVEGNMAYIASADWEGGLVSVDISDPENPAIQQIYNPSGWFHPFNVGSSWPYAYASDIYGELYVFDVSDPSNMIEMETLTLPGFILNILPQDEFIYVSDGQAGIQILENSLITGVSESSNPVSAASSVEAYPNPASGPVTLTLTLSESSFTRVNIFDITGKSVSILAEDEFDSGNHKITWNGTNDAGNRVPDGIYVYTVSAGAIKETGKIVIQR